MSVSESIKPEEQGRKIMTWKEAMEYVEELSRYGIAPGLTNMENLCEKLGNPQRELKFVHIAGTNGKGSVTAFISEILKMAGYRTGRYISPAVIEHREIMQIGGRSISKKEFCRMMSLMRDVCQKLQEEGKPHPTLFEVETAMAFAYFREQKCRIVVLEAGCGGLLDATNIVRETVVSVITSVSLDHMGLLGKTLREIAEHKAGIMKPGVPAVVLRGPKEVMEVFRRKAGELEIPLTLVDPGEARGIKRSLERQSFSWKEYKNLTITMAGLYQIENAVLALEVIRVLSGEGAGSREGEFLIPEKAVCQGLRQAFWPGRFQILSKKPLLIADGAHNRDGARRLAESLRFYFTNRRILYIIGMLRNKEQAEVLKETCPLAEQVLTISTRGERGFSAYELAQIAEKYHGSVTAADSLEEAVELARLFADKDTVTVAFGSLSFLGELMEIEERRSKKQRFG